MKNSALTMTVQQTECAVLIMSLCGHLDGGSFTELIEEAQTLYNKNRHPLILDLTGVKKVTLAGLFGLHSIAAIFNGEEPLPSEGGWHTLRTMKHDLDKGPQARFKLSSPQPQVRHLLNQTGFASFVDVYDDVGTAVSSFATETKPMVMA